MKDKTVRRKLYHRRSFLNTKDVYSIAAINANVALSETPTHIDVEADLTLSDCSQQISLDFNIWMSSVDKQWLRQRRKKAETFRTIINRFLDSVEEAYDEIEKKMPAKEAEAKRREKTRKNKKKK